MVYYPLYCLGPGLRVGVWFQGCSIHCKDCISKHAWKETEGYIVSLDMLFEQLKQYPTDKITISGGEPFDQPDALFCLLVQLKELKYTDIFIYSGYQYEHLKVQYPDIVSKIDVLVDGTFEKDRKTHLIWKGSENQRMHIVSSNQEIMDTYQEYQTNCSNRKLQVIEKNGNIYIVGIP